MCISNFVCWVYSVHCPRHKYKTLLKFIYLFWNDNICQKSFADNKKSINKIRWIWRKIRLCCFKVVETEHWSYFQYNSNNSASHSWYLTTYSCLTSYTLHSFKTCSFLRVGQQRSRVVYSLLSVYKILQYHIAGEHCAKVQKFIWLRLNVLAVRGFWECFGGVNISN